MTAPEPPHRSALYRHPNRSGRYQATNITADTVVLKSTDTVNIAGERITIHVPRDDWPERWTRA